MTFIKNFVRNILELTISIEGNQLGKFFAIQSTVYTFAVLFFFRIDFNVSFKDAG